MNDAAPMHEPEVLAARNMRKTAEHGLPPGWLTPAESDDVMIAEAVRWAKGWAERAFLGSVGMTPKRADKAVTACVVEMMAEGHRAADIMGATPGQRTTIEVGRATLFDHRLAFLRAFAILPPGRA